MPGCLKIWKYAFLNTEKVYQQKLFSDIFKVEELEVCFFKIFVKGDKQKIVPCCLKIRKYTFFNIWKEDNEKIFPDIFTFGSMLFLNIWKGG